MTLLFLAAIVLPWWFILEVDVGDERPFAWWNA